MLASSQDVTWASLPKKGPKYLYSRIVECRVSILGMVSMIW